MPTEIKITAKTEKVCEPCKHLHAYNRLCSRLYGISEDYACTHPAVGFRTIGHNHNRQPQWCPLKQETRQ